VVVLVAVLAAEVEQAVLYINKVFQYQQAKIFRLM
jgi:hypothetical protein